MSRTLSVALGLLLCTGALGLLLCTGTLAAQKTPKQQELSGYDRAARATVLHVTNVYANPDTEAPPLETVLPGHEIVVLAHNGPWVRILANTDSDENDEDENAPEFSDKAAKDPASGWIHDKGIVGVMTPNGAALLFGAAANLEAQAEQPRSPKDAAPEAHLLYRRASEYFPDSPLAAEAAFRSADIRWQLQAADISTLPSAKEQEAYLRPQIYEGELKRVMKRFGDTPWAARAAYVLIGNKLCGDWQGLPKCPEMEAGLYQKYADRYPGGPKSAEALYQAAYREAVVVTMYAVDEDSKRGALAVKRCNDLAGELHDKFPQSEFTPRAAALAFKASQGIPITGSDRE